MNNAAKPVPCLGFLTVVEDAEQGLLGGYLLLNVAGRPLEFHCTAPVKANRAQEILYGPTLRPFLYGELIGQTLLAKSKLAPLLVCTDSEPMLAVRDHTHLPVALIVQSENLPRNNQSQGTRATEESSLARTDPASAAGMPRITLGSSEVVLPAPYRADEQAIRAAWPSQADHLDLGEPFARIREALEEAQKTARAVKLCTTGCTTCCSRRWNRWSADADDSADELACFRSNRSPTSSKASLSVPRYSAVLADEMGLGKDDAGDQHDPSAAVLGRSAQRAADLPEAAGQQLAPRVHAVGARDPGGHHRRRPRAAAMAVDGTGRRRRIANYELLMRDRDLVTTPRPAFRPGRAGRSAADQEPVQHDQPSGPRDPAHPQLGLTGTPVENSPDDLVGIFDFLSPGYLSPGMKPRAMAKATRDYILRRTKDMVLTDMPPKLFRDAELELSPSNGRRTKPPRTTGSAARRHGGGDHDPARVRAGPAAEADLQLRSGHRSQLQIGTAGGRHGRSRGQRPESDHLQPVGHSAWKNSATLHRFGTLEYHGKIPSKQRDERHRTQFKNDPSKHVILMSYGAGSVGLNLQFCRYVFLFDRWWNPAIEDQAINRAHRIGVAGSVTVTRMLTVGTIEEAGHLRPGDRPNRRPGQRRPLATRHLRPLQPAHAQRGDQASGIKSAG
jgi:hypothetical protein